MNIINKLKNISYYNGKPVEVIHYHPTWFSYKRYADYERKRQNFNTYYQFKPIAIVYCECAKQVSEVILIANKEKCILRLRSGGHDHEGECSATDAIVIDLSKMNQVSFDRQTKIAEIEPGAKFEDLVQALDRFNVAIPHGTCPSVAIAGFTSGGGWGPWTRAKGMCCESLVAASIVLGDGQIVDLDEKTDQGKELLWALKGGGGMSYGIITKLYFQTFPLPDELLKFELRLGGRFRSIDVFKVWEKMIEPRRNPKLTGTNIRIKAHNPNDDTSSGEDCIIYGSYADSAEALKTKIKILFKPFDVSEDLLKEILRIDQLRKNGERVVAELFFKELYASWELPLPVAKGATVAKGGSPSPHKITSRVVVEGGLGDSGRKNLHDSLNSTTLPIDKELQPVGIECYATHNAISGEYYANYKNGNSLSSFPYKKRPFIIQYQAWWNLKAKNYTPGFEKYLNSVLDWQQECRDRPFPETSGSFISFKDASIMTKHYFAESYDELKRIKIKWSKDPNNFLSSRKTII